MLAYQSCVSLEGRLQCFRYDHFGFTGPSIYAYRISGKKMYTKVTNVHKGLIAPLAIRFSANLFLSVWDKSGDTTVGARFFVYDEARSY